MRNIKLTIQYDGSQFNGWQTQPSKRTVQGEIELALKKIFKSKIRLYGSGRTDTGVHAWGQVANFHIDSPITLNKIKSAINNNIGDDVAIVKVEEAAAEFHSQYAAKQKTYIYRIVNTEIINPTDRFYFYHYPYTLALRNMQESAKIFIGTHDFKSFQSNNRVNQNQDTIRTIKNLKVSKSKDYINIKITANGFLYKMVRNIVGVLLDVGAERLNPQDVQRILKSRNRTVSSKSAPAHGLILEKVVY